MKCSCFSPLLKAINAYLQKADDDLEDELAAAGFADTDRTMNAIRSMEDEVAAALVAETQLFVAAAGEALDLQAFANDIWPGVRLNDQLAKKLTEIFKKRFTELMPGLVETYLQRTDTMLDVPRISKITTGWIETWSAKLGDMMQLNSHTELENILTEGLRNGDGIAVFTRKILDSGIRDEYYKARRVSVTEVLRAHNVAHQEAFMQSPSVIEKIWRHSGEYRITPRENHVAMDGTKVGKAERFTLEGLDGNTYYPMYPVDPDLPAGESINCHCICEPIVDPEILGMSLEDRQALQQKIIDEMDDEWEKELDARNRAKAGIEA